METKKQVEAFNYYYEMPKRSYTDVAKKFKVSVTSIANWAKKYTWEFRINQRLREEEDQFRIKLSRERAKKVMKHLESYELMIEKAFEAIKTKEFKNASDAAKVLDLAIRGERELLGYTDRNISLESLFKRDVHQEWLDMLKEIRESKFDRQLIDILKSVQKDLEEEDKHKSKLLKEGNKTVEKNQ